MGADKLREPPTFTVLGNPHELFGIPKPLQTFFFGFQKYWLFTASFVSECKLHAPRGHLAAGGAVAEGIGNEGPPCVSRGRRRWTWWPGAWTWPRWSSTSAATGASTTPSGTTAGSWTRSKPTWYCGALPCRGFQRCAEGATVTQSQAVWAQTRVCDFFPDRLGIFFFILAVGHCFEYWSVVDLRCCG